MGIDSIGSLYLNESRLSLSTGALSETPSTGTSFASILDKAAKQPAGSGEQSVKPHIDKTDKLYEQCEALETFLIKNLISGMRATVSKSGFIDQSFAGKMYEDMLYDEYAKDFSKNAHFGLAELAYLELSGQRGKVPGA
ncbi:MAG: rod-binding protein [Treponema sp.]|jgi:flagellar protein FlgJ|nr:rod-binding protein [Treponema sp.]